MPELSLDKACRLSRFVHIRPVPGGIVVESLLSGRSLRLDTLPLLNLLLAFAVPGRPTDLLRSLPEPQREVVSRFVQRCYDDQLLVGVDPAGQSAEDDGPLAYWEFHDLLFHVHSRRGRTRQPIGATYRFRQPRCPEPVFKPPTRDPGVSLFRPDLERLRHDDLPLTYVLEERRSLYDIQPITLTELGEFLYRTCRVTSVVKKPSQDQVAQRVYPSGGSRHSLELYAIALRCQGLDAGLYHYRPAEHVLVPLSALTCDLEQLLREAQVATDSKLSGYPSVLFVVTARFQRVTWKYQSLAYSAILKEVGALYQTMYLVGTAMTLAPCAIGAGDADRFARAAGLNYYQETSVGEFVLSGRQSGPAHESTAHVRDAVP